ncbi:MAG TPA: hypothetical protein VM223_11780, partial [Planctomycetota bacterium]|nr:hypothetical protein [Planctomycetota bacterium]
GLGEEGGTVSILSIPSIQSIRRNRPHSGQQNAAPIDTNGARPGKFGKKPKQSYFFLISAFPLPIDIFRPPLADSWPASTRFPADF